VVRPNDVKVANHNFFGSTYAKTPAYINTFFNGNRNGGSHLIVVAKVEDRDNTMDILLTEVDKVMKAFFQDA
jgi:hypothetical protein